MASLRHFSALPKNSLCSDRLAYARLCLKNENYILDYLKILGLYPLLKKFVINLLCKSKIELTQNN